MAWDEPRLVIRTHSGYINTPLRCITRPKRSSQPRSVVLSWRRIAGATENYQTRFKDLFIWSIQCKLWTSYRLMAAGAFQSRRSFSSSQYHYLPQRLGCSKNFNATDGYTYTAGETKCFSRVRSNDMTLLIWKCCWQLVMGAPYSLRMFAAKDPI